MFFSVIVPVYNVEPYIEACIDSVRGQTCSDWELILVNDGSTDGSGGICDAYASRDDRIRVIHKDNGGQSSARNAGLSQARGSYVLFLDSDDYFLSDTFLQAVQEEALSGCDLVLYKYQKVWDDGHRQPCPFSFAGMEPSSSLADTLEQLIRRDAFFCSAWSKSVRRELLVHHQIRFDESLSCEDMDWYYQVLQHASTLRLLDTPYIAYRQRDHSVTSTVKAKTIVDFITVVRRWSAFFTAKGPDGEVWLQSLTKLYCNLLVALGRYKGPDKAALRAQVRELSFLLKYDWNPRAKQFARIYRVCGFRGLLVCLRLADRLK